MLYNNKYYAYGTGGTTKGEGSACFSSDDLKNWKREGQALSAADSYGKWGFWAPEVYYIESKKKFYMFYSVEEHICVATSDSPVGPFRQEVKQPVWEEKSIDTSLFIDDDGTPYLYFVRFTDGNVIWVARMTDDLMKIKTETLSQCVKAEAPWELLQAKVAEGPSVLKKNGTYYLIYSANHYQNKGYGVGYATSKSPMGPWIKYSKNPLLQGVGGHGIGRYGAWRAFSMQRWQLEIHFPCPLEQRENTSAYFYFKDFAISDQGVVSISGEVIEPRVMK